LHRLFFQVFACPVKQRAERLESFRPFVAAFFFTFESEFEIAGATIETDVLSYA
jgi:hypothetical protein